MSKKIARTFVLALALQQPSLASPVRHVQSGGSGHLHNRPAALHSRGRGDLQTALRNVPRFAVGSHTTALSDLRRRSAEDVIQTLTDGG
jgi:hypothetical protein